ncbi:MAG: YfhO family protein, partial [Acidobacteria bacterium]|nr:YfhO family protein [Acidobacteriota bacterium]
VPAFLMFALLAGWGFDALLHAGPTMPHRRGRILTPLKCLLAGVVALWIISVVVPSWVTIPAQWILLRTNEMFMRSMAGALTAAQTAEATTFLLAMLRWQLPGLAGFALASLLLIVAWERRKNWACHAAVGAALLALAQLVGVNDRANPTVPESFYAYRPPVLAEFEDSAQPYRFSYIFQEPDAPPGTPEVQGFLNLDSVPEAAGLSPPAQMAFRDRLVLARGSMMEKVEGISNIDVERSFPPFLYDFWVFALRGLSDPEQLDCLLGRANVRYQILPRHRTGRNIRDVATIFNGSPQPHYLYENLFHVPRVYAVKSATYSTDGTETLKRLASPDFDPAREVILVGKSGGWPPAAPDGEPGRVEFLERRPGAVTLRAQLPQEGYVILLDRFDPNWHATLDGREVPVARANHMFRAVGAPAGDHEIRFYYRQRGLRAGLMLSFAAAVLLGFLYFFDPGGRDPN